MSSEQYRKGARTGNILLNIKLLNINLFNWLFKHYQAVVVF